MGNTKRSKPSSSSEDDPKPIVKALSDLIEIRKQEIKPPQLEKTFDGAFSNLHRLLNKLTK